MSLEIGNNISWSSQIEYYLKEVAEKSHSYSYLHKKAEAKYDYSRTFIDIPSITFSTIAGTLSIGNESLFGEKNAPYSSIGIGILSLVVGVLGTIGSYFSWGKRAENHRLAHLQYGKLYRFIQIELSLPREQRIRCSDLMKIVRETYERLQELSPLIPIKLIEDFKTRFADYKDRVSFPTETNGLEEVEIYTPKSINQIEIEERSRSFNLVNENNNENQILENV